MLFNLLIIGAGNVNFGSTEGPWCHTTRFEKKLGHELKVVGLVDPATDRAQARLADKQQAGVVGYEQTRVFKSIQAAGESLENDQPHLVLLGTQPSVRGSSTAGKDAELQIKAHFPNIAIFTEKPISSSSIDDVLGVAKQIYGTTTSVGYMLRYLKAVSAMKNTIKDNNVTVMSTLATYIMAYEFAGTRKDRMGYFDKQQEMGPIVGQATHIVDLCRYLSGEAQLDTVAAVTVEAAEKPGNLSRLLHEGGIEEVNKIPRITTALWKWENGATGSLTHGVALHGDAYDVELTVIADGWKMRLVDPYGACRLYTRRPGKDDEEVTVFKDDDPFYSEVSVIVDVVRGNKPESDVLSSYSDAIQTYALTWAIRLAGEASSAHLNGSVRERVRVD